MRKINIENTLRRSVHPYITDIELKTLINSTPNGMYSKVKRLTAEGKLLHIRRGLYSLTEELGYYTKPHMFELAQHVYGPSYISLESALSFHGLIPEAVYSITSVCTKRSTEFKTPIGVFSYKHLPAEGFYTEVGLVSQDQYKFLIASPWRAICDYAFCYKRYWASLKSLLEDMRINYEDLPELRDKELFALNEYYKNKRLNKFLTQIKEDFDSYKNKSTTEIAVNLTRSQA